MEAKVNRSLIQLSVARRQALRLRRWRQGGKEASIEVEAVVARRQGGKEAGGKGSVGGERKCCTLVARCSHDFLT